MRPLYGAYIRIYPPKLMSSIIYVGCYICLILISWAFKIISLTINSPILNIFIGHNALIQYTSPTILLAAIVLLLLFRNLQFTNKFQKIIGVLSPLAFSVYIIQTHPLIWEHILKDYFGFLATVSTPLMLVSVMGIVIAVFISASAVDFVREILFTKLKVKAVVTHYESKLLAVLEKTQ